MSSLACAYLENQRPSRARKGISRTLSRQELEERLEPILQKNGEHALNQLREEMRLLAPKLELEKEFQAVETLIGSLLGTKEDTLLSPLAQARLNQSPYDEQRLHLFQILRDYLVSTAPQIRPAKVSDNIENLAFFEAYFSNFIEGTEFPLEEAYNIVFENQIPLDRPADAHDVTGTYRLVSNLNEMQKVPKSLEDLLSLLANRHSLIMEGRPEKNPGKFKTCSNRAGKTVFVAPELVKETLERGFEIYQTLSEPFHRAVYMMFFIAEIHPFADGNGRLARVVMNAELVTAAETRSVIPFIYVNSYLGALKTLSQAKRPAPLQRTLDFAQKYTASLDWSSYSRCQHQLEVTNAFMDPHVADLEGIRLMIP